MTERMTKPQLIIFDLDYTLWPFWIDTHVDPPFTKDKKGDIYDRRHRKILCYSDVPCILQELHSEGYVIGIASRTTETEEAKALVKLFDWTKYITYSEIYPTQKTVHFGKFHEKSKIPYDDMLFFDDEGRNIRDVSELGVTCVLAPDGMTKALLNEGLQQFTDNKAKQNR